MNLRRLLAVCLLMVAVVECQEDLISLDQKWQIHSKRKPASEWSVSDVSLWMNFTLGYPEYSQYITMHQIDGPTLLYLTAEDFDLYFPIEHGIHIVKLRAHLDLLRGKCLCPNSNAESLDFWGLLRSENKRMVILGGTALQFPRLAMLGSYFFDYEGSYVPLLRAAERMATTSTEDSENDTVKEISVGMSCAFWFSIVVCPDAFMAFVAVQRVSTNWFVVPFFIFHFLLQLYNELYLVYLLWKGETVFPDECKTLWKRFWYLHSWFSLVPLISLVSGYIMPLLLQQLVIWVLCGHALMVFVGIVLNVLGIHGPSPPGTEPEAANGEDKKSS